MTKWTLVFWLLSIGWSARCQEEFSGASIVQMLQSPGILDDNSESQLVKMMIAKALEAKSQKDNKPVTIGHVAKLLEDPTTDPSSSPELMTKTDVTEPDVPGTTPDDIMAKNHENEIVYEPVEHGQFGEPGEGSKFLEAIQNFDISKYSVETDGDYSTLAGIGAAALLTIGAIAAVPVAPLILRRAGTSGWSGLPSFSELWGWWSEPDPVAEKFANSDYNDNYINRPHQRQKPGRPNKQRPAKRPYQQTAQRPYQQYADEEEDTYEYDYGVNQASEYDNSAWYSDYYDSGSSPSNTNQQYEPETEPSGPSAQAPSGHAPTGHYNRPSAEHVRPPHHSGNHRPVANNRRQNRPVKNQERTPDGHEYTTVEELNKLGEESLKTIYEQFSAHMQGQNIQDFYQDNELRRRYDEHAYMERQGQVLPGETSYEYEQELMENTHKLSRNYLNNYGQQESEERIEDGPTRVKEFPYDWETFPHE